MSDSGDKPFISSHSEEEYEFEVYIGILVSQFEDPPPSCVEMGLNQLCACHYQRTPNNSGPPQISVFLLFKVNNKNNFVFTWFTGTWQPFVGV